MVKYEFHKTFILIFSIIALFVFVNNTNAEFKVTNEDINVEVIPNNPAPYTDVDIKLESFATDLNKAVIDWKIGGKTVLSGIGRTTYSFKAGAPNTQTVIDVSITPVGGIMLVQQITIKPSEVELLYQAVDSYTPPFYKGRALPIHEGKIKVVAMPNTVNVAQADNKKMVYNWTRNSNSASSLSGYGKDSFTFTNDILLDSENIGLSTSSVNGAYSATGSIEIPVTNPKMIFYKKSPINGTLYNNALGDNTTMVEDEMTIVAEPYFINSNSADFQYSWKINGNTIDTPSRKNELTIRPSSRGGYATVSLSIESVTKLFQSITNSIRINL